MPLYEYSGSLTTSISLVKKHEKNVLFASLADLLRRLCDSYKLALSITLEYLGFELPISSLLYLTPLCFPLAMCSVPLTNWGLYHLLLAGLAIDIALPPQEHYTCSPTVDNPPHMRDIPEEPFEDNWFLFMDCERPPCWPEGIFHDKEYVA
jgi:hypothetical protein